MYLYKNSNLNQCNNNKIISIIIITTIIIKVVIIIILFAVWFNTLVLSTSNGKLREEQIFLF